MNPVLKPFRKSELKWYLWDNYRRWSAYRLNPAQLNDHQAGLIQRLNTDGIARTSVSELFDPGVWDELLVVVDRLLREKADEMERLRQSASEPGVKNYVIPLLGRRPRLDVDDIFVRVALQSRVLAVANAYFGLYTKLLQYNVIYNVPSGSEPVQSQLWHRDPEDRRVLKMFVYLTGVDIHTGPFFYAKGTHSRGPIKGNPAFIRDDSLDARRSTDDQMSLVCPPDHWVEATGLKGSVVLADTRGYHKGGHVRCRDRVLYQCTFTSAAASARVLRADSVPGS